MTDYIKSDFVSVSALRSSETARFNIPLETPYLGLKLPYKKSDYPETLERLCESPQSEVSAMKPSAPGGQQ